MIDHSLRAPRSVRIRPKLTDLTEIVDPAVNVLVHPRAVPTSVATEARNTALRRGLALRLVLAPADAARAIAAALPEAEALAADVGFWVEVLAELTGSPSIGLRLVRLDAAMCPRFHADNIHLRLLSTYLGRGTEYLDDADVNRCRLGHASAGEPDENSGVLKPGARIRQAAAGDVVLLKGARWPGNEGAGAVHRSPAASGDATRLVMTLDAL